MNTFFRKRYAVVALFGALVCGACAASAAAPEPSPLTDVSGVKYYETALALIGGATESVVITLPSAEPSDAAFMRLIGALDAALKRGVRAEVFVNAQYSVDGWVWLTKAFAGYDPSRIQVYPVAANHLRFHRLVITDGTHVLEGALDWSRDRRGETDLAQSADNVARAFFLTEYLRKMPHAGSVKTAPGAPQWRSVLCGIPPSVDRMTFPVALVTDDRFIPAMAKRDDIASVRALLMLYAAAAYAKNDTFQVDLARVAVGIGASGDLSAAKDAIRRMAKRYGICTIAKKDLAGALEVTLIRPQGASFPLPVDIADPDFLVETPYPLTMGFVVECYFRSIPSKPAP